MSEPCRPAQAMLGKCPYYSAIFFTGISLALQAPIISPKKKAR